MPLTLIREKVKRLLKRPKKSLLSSRTMKMTTSSKPVAASFGLTTQRVKKTATKKFIKYEKDESGLFVYFLFALSDHICGRKRVNKIVLKFKGKKKYVFTSIGLFVMATEEWSSFRRFKFRLYRKFVCRASYCF